MEEVFGAILSGNAVFFLDGYDKAMKISSKGYPGLAVSEVKTEKVLRGSKEGFCDSVKTNAALVRKRIRDTRLKVEQSSIGVRSNTVVQLLYVEDLVHEELLTAVKERLESFAVDGILDSGMLEQLTEEAWYSPFPQFQTTERPDRAAQELLNGKAVLLCDNSPVALVVPGAFNSFMESSEDWYNRFEMASSCGCSGICHGCGNAAPRTLSGCDPVSYTDPSGESDPFLCTGKRGRSIFQCSGAGVPGTVF